MYLLTYHKIVFYRMLIPLVICIISLVVHADAKDQHDSLSFNQQKLLNDQLFLSIGSCDPVGVSNALKKGANVHATYDMALNKQLRIGLVGEYTPIAFAVLGFHCWSHFNRLPMFEDKLNHVLTNIKSVLEVLMAAGADPHQLIDNHLSRGNQKIPAMRLAFHTDVASAIAVPFFKKIVELGGNPNVLDSKGYGVLYDYSMAQLSIEDLNTLLDIGVDPTLSNPKNGYNQANLFPFFYRKNDDLKKVLSIMSDQKIKFNKGNYTRSYINHPLAREISYVMGLYFELDNRRERMRIIKNELAPLLKDILNIEVGQDNRHILAYLMKDICPTTHYKDHTYFPFVDGYGSYRVKNTIESQKLAEAYKWFIRLIDELDFDLEFRDTNNIDLMTYAMHYCPFEVVEKIYQKAQIIPTIDQIEKSDELVKNVKKLYGKTSYFNNDHRTVEFLLKNNVSLEWLKKYLSQSNNPRINDIVKQSLHQWRSLDEVGLDYMSVMKIPARVSYLYDIYTDIKETKINLSDPQDQRTYQFNGRFLSVNLGAQSNPTRYRGIAHNRFSLTHFNYSVDSGRINYEFFGDFSYTGSALLKEISSEGKVALYINEANTLASRQFTDYEQEMIDATRLSPYVLDDPQTRYGIQNEYVYKQPGKSILCSVILCNYLKLSQITNGKAYLTVKEESLKNDFFYVYVLWDYLNTPIEERKLKRDEIRRTFNVETMAFFLDLIQTDYSSLRQEEESIDFIDMIISFELQNKLAFDIEPLIKKMKSVKALTEAGHYYIDTRLYLLTNQNIKQAYARVTMSFAKIQEYLLLSESVAMMPIYKSRYQALRNMIANNLDLIVMKLKLNDTQVDDIKRSL